MGTLERWIRVIELFLTIKASLITSTKTIFLFWHYVPAIKFSSTFKLGTFQTSVKLKEGSHLGSPVITFN